MSQEYTPTWPDFEVTIHRHNGQAEYVRCMVDGRLCNMHYYGAKYLTGEAPPRYPVPALIGVVEYRNYQDALEIIITDCDEKYDPRLCYAVMRCDGFVIDDYPHDSPNYR